MEIIKNIFVVVPASAEYQPTIQYAIRMAQDLDARLIIALVYTCNVELEGKEPQDEVSLSHQKEYVKETFEQLKAKQLAHTSLDYKLVSVDGPFWKAILAAAPTYHPDLIITTAIQRLPLQELILQIPYHLLLVPIQTKYKPIHHLGLAFDANLIQNIEPVLFVSQLAKTYRADIEVLEFGHVNAVLSISSNRANVELDFLLKDVVHRFHLGDSEKAVVENIEHYIEEHPTDMLVMLACPQVLAYNEKEKNTVKIATNASVPVLVLKN
ncbi:universal stress protein [Catalinimonas niigatensis]|uniref:universal stress protein n=1 Tax=Catalinimonas niigatensis TaxID=1397264 RepID=UPI002666E83D|nr:universal stress protein [Catalinimonas niigatensis]WPP49791.1 universal stress protein [Catalinimonas niigatensis]